MSRNVVTVGNREVAEVAASVRAMSQEMGAMRAELRTHLEKITKSTSRLDRRLLAIEGSATNPVKARIDSLLDRITITHVDIQGLALDLEQAHDRVCSSLDGVRSGVCEAVQNSQMATSKKLDGLSKAVMDSNSRTKHAFLEMSQGLDTNNDALVTKLDNMSKIISSTVCTKIDNANENINKLVVESRDHVHDRIDQLQLEVESSRRRINERLNNTHEALAGIMNTSRERVFQEIERTSSSLSAVLPLMRDVIKVHKGYIKKEIKSEEVLGAPICPNLSHGAHATQRRKRLETVLRFSR